MALQNPATGEYLKITSIQLGDWSSINYDIYANLEHRENGDTEFLHKKTGTVNSGALQAELAKNANSTKSIIDNFKTAGYKAIVADSFDFSAWESV